MTTYSSRLSSLVQSPAALNGYWGLPLPQKVRFYATLYTVMAQTTTSWTDLVQATSVTPGVTFDLATFYAIGIEKTDLEVYVNYVNYQSFFEFDTSSIGSTRAVTSVSFKIFTQNYNQVNIASNSFWIIPYDFGAIDSTDYRTQTWFNANLSSYVGTLPTSAFSTAGLKTATNSSNMIAAINRTGMTRFVLLQDYQRTQNTEPVGDVFATGGYSGCFLEITYV
jgi:hypothetical protein